MAGDDVPAGLRQAFLEHGPDMLGLVLANTPVRFAWVPGYADYYPEAPGGLAAGRSIEPVPFDGRKSRRRTRPPRPALPAVPRGHHPGRVPLAEPRARIRGASAPRLRVAGRAARARLPGHRVLSLGQALAAGLRAGLAASGVPVWLDTPLAGLE